MSAPDDFDDKGEEKDVFGFMQESERRSWLEKLDAMSDDELREHLKIDPPAQEKKLANGFTLRLIKGGAK